MVDNVIVLAGGSGTRLWPASIAERPKQFFDPGTGKSLLQMTVERAAAVAPRGNIVIVTHVSQLDRVLEDCVHLVVLRERITILPEPEARNTAPAIAFALAYLRDSGAGEETSLVLASDHLITPIEEFAADVERADELAREGYLTTFGVTPTRPEVGYGYIEAGESHAGGNLVASFREKPDADTAASYVSAGRFYWNSGMFVFANNTLWDELSTHAPEITTTFAEIDELSFEDRRAYLVTKNREGITIPWKGGFLDQLYSQLPRISFDYAVMEKSTRTAMVEATFRWNDIGSWDEMAQLTDDGIVGQKGGNSYTPRSSGATQPSVQLECTNTYVYSELPVVLCDVEDISVIVKHGRVLVVKRGSGQMVREAIRQLREDGHEDVT